MLVNRCIPWATVIPVLPYPDVVAATAWLCDAFGFSLRLGIGNHRAQLNVGHGAVILSEQQAGDARGAHSVMVRVEDLDRHHEHAIQRGARVLLPPADHPYGERQYRVEDFAGHQWTFSQSIVDADPQKLGFTIGHL